MLVRQGVGVGVGVGVGQSAVLTQGVGVVYRLGADASGVAFVQLALSPATMIIAAMIILFFIDSPKYLK